jgi:hypothetical protein
MALETASLAASDREAIWAPNCAKDVHAIGWSNRTISMCAETCERTGVAAGIGRELGVLVLDRIS